MKKISLLDCTLRDGGYVNDWEFGQNNLVRIYERLVDTGVDIIEVGFLDDRRPFDLNRSIMPDTYSAEKIWGCSSKRPPMVVGMIDYGTCKIENLQPCEESFFDGIRVIFKKHLMHEAMEYCRQVKELGYKVFSQLVSITSYTDEDLHELIKLVNDVKPYAVSIVDTYGLLHPKNLLHYYEILDKYVDPKIQIGFHAHNNFQLAYANVLTFLEKESHHDILVDGTLYGMGKSAGNAPLELLAMQLNENFEADYKIQPMLESIEESVLDFYKTAPWGYQMFYYLCGYNKCHPNYVNYLQEKNNLSVSKLDSLLSRIEPEDKKLLYDGKIAESIYENFLTEEADDTHCYARLEKELSNRELLLIGPGKNIALQETKIIDYITNHKPVIISVNYIPAAIKPDYIFITNTKRYLQMAAQLQSPTNKDIKLIGTSNIECVNGAFTYHFNRAPLIEQAERIKDNSFLMLLKILKKSNVKVVTCAGFDGYSQKEDNYLNPKMEYNFVKDATSYLNTHIKEKIGELRESLEINFLTYSHYDEMGDNHDAAF